MKETNDSSRLIDRKHDLFGGQCCDYGEPRVGENIALGEQVNIAAIKRTCQKCERERRFKAIGRTCPSQSATGLPLDRPGRLERRQPWWASVDGVKED